MNKFFTADHHLDHSNILKHSNRPWLKAEDLDENGEWISRERAKERATEMTEAMIDNHNSVVTKKDITYFLGDLCWGNGAKHLERMNGRKVWVTGNHDKKQIKQMKHLFEEVYIKGHPDFNFGKRHITLSHYPLLSWNRSCHGSWCLCGHSHGMCPQSRPEAWRMFLLDVGVDLHDYKPLSLDQVCNIMKNKEELRQQHQHAADNGIIM